MMDARNIQYYSFFVKISVTECIPFHKDCFKVVTDKNRQEVEAL